MAVRLTLQFNRRPAVALAVAEPWTRLLVEVESPENRGFHAGGSLVVRKSASQDGIIDRLIVEQMTSEADMPQRCLDACDWWLGKAPFCLARLPVALVAHRYEDALICLPDCRLTQLDLSTTERCNTPLNLATLQERLSLLEALDISTTYPHPRQVVHADVLRASAPRLQLVNMAGTDIDTLDFLPTDALESVDVSKCTKLSHVRRLGDAHCLRCFRATAVAAESVEPLRACARLEEVEVSRWHHLTDLSPLQTSSRGLRHIGASCTAIASVGCLAACHSLKRLEVACCAELRDLSPLAGLASLEALVAYSTGVEVLGNLSLCPRLSTVDLSFSERLTTLAGLAGAPSLTTLNAYRSAVRSLDGLNTCPKLECVTVSECQDLHSLSPLAGSPSLARLYAHNSGISDVSGLGQCPKLAEATVSSCRRLSSLAGFAGAASLVVLDAQASGANLLTGLNTCPSLEVVILKGCTDLRDISPLAGAPALWKIDASGSGTTCARGLDACPLLTKLSLHQCPVASDAQALQKLLKARKRKKLQRGSPCDELKTPGQTSS